MIEIENVLVSDEVLDKNFVCDLDKCKGACCVEGDLGAPIALDEVEIMEDIYEKVVPYLTPEGKALIEQEGVVVEDFEGDLVTPTISGRECAYAVYDENRVLKCAIELAHLDGKIEFKKPISCHLYPIRVTKLNKGEAVNYDSWSICSDACVLGDELKVPVYKFLKDPLIRKYGKTWYEKLEREAESTGQSK